MSLSLIPQLELISNLTGSDLLRLCQTNRSFRQLCQQDVIWETKMDLEYPNYVSFKPDGMTWRRYYLLSMSSTPIIFASLDGHDRIPSQLVDSTFIRSYVESRFGSEPMIGLRDRIIVFYGYWNHQIPTTLDTIIILAGDEFPNIKIGSASCINASPRQIIEFLRSMAITIDPRLNLSFASIPRYELCCLAQIMSTLIGD